jgi:hypothetical protein
MGPLLTAENLLKAVAITNEQVESWYHGGLAHPGTDTSDPVIGRPLSPPPEDLTHLTIHVRLRPPAHLGADDESREPETPSTEWWQGLEARWNAILGLEATIEGLRLRMESLRGEMEAASKKTLTTEEKAHALNADVAQWNKAKGRVHYAVPKMREFAHRATWATGTPERKKLEELFKNHIEPQVPFPEMDRLPEQLENLLKDRQVLSAQGTAVYEECKSISAEIQGALRTLQSNAAANARNQMSASRRKGKFV